MTTARSSRHKVPPGQARILIADALNDRGMQILEEAGLRAEARTGLSEAQLCEIVGEYDGLIVRSATQVTRNVLEAGRKLQVVGRAGVGVDNIDLEAATRAGVIVQNTPLGNICSAAEHAVALLFASARHIPKADREMKAGKWGKKGLTGVELSEKTLGIVGLGKVASIVMRVAKALNMRVLAFDPYLTDRRAQDLGVTKTDLDPLLQESDFVSIHSPLTPETRGLIHYGRLAKMKKTARLVNCARGGIVVEEDLARALREGLLAGAALDVFEQEPLSPESPLRGCEGAILTPHLGASTAEAQERVAEDIARQFVEFFRDGVIRNAINIDITLDPKIASFAKLAETLGALAAQLVAPPGRTLKVGAYGRLAQGETKELGVFALKGVLARSTKDPVSLVNARMIAESRGLELVEHKSEKAGGYASLLVVALEGEAGEHTVAGTCFDEKVGRIVRIDDFDIEIRPAKNLLLMFYPDQPGMVGRFGTILGEADINIANMAVGRREKRGQAVVALTLDDPVTPAVLQRIKESMREAEIHAIQL